MLELGNTGVDGSELDPVLGVGGHGPGASEDAVRDGALAGVVLALGSVEGGGAELKPTLVE